MDRKLTELKRKREQQTKEEIEKVQETETLREEVQGLQLALAEITLLITSPGGEEDAI